MDKFFNPDETYNNAIKNKDIGVLRALLTGIIGSDPTFATTEFDEAKRYIDDQSMAVNGERLEITEAYKIQEDEVDDAEWNEKYFQMNLVWLRDNFNLDNRLPKIKKIGQVVYKNKTTLGKSKAENRRQVATESKTISVGERKNVQKKEQTIRTIGDGHSNNSRLTDKIAEWITDHWVGVAIGATFVIVVIISLIIKVIGKN